MVAEQTWHDLRRAFRDLRRARGVALPGVLMLAVGIAGTTVMFTLIQGVLLRPLPVRDPDRLVGGWKELPAVGGMAHYPYANTEIESSRPHQPHAGERRRRRLQRRLASLVFENGAPGYIDLHVRLGRVLPQSSVSRPSSAASSVRRTTWKARRARS